LDGRKWRRNFFRRGQWRSRRGRRGHDGLRLFGCGRLRGSCGLIGLELSRWFFRWSLGPDGPGLLLPKANQRGWKADGQDQRCRHSQLDLGSAGPRRRPRCSSGRLLRAVEAPHRRLDRRIASNRPRRRRVGQGDFRIWRHFEELIAAIARRSNRQVDGAAAGGRTSGGP